MRSQQVLTAGLVVLAVCVFVYLVYPGGRVQAGQFDWSGLEDVAPVKNQALPQAPQQPVVPALQKPRKIKMYVAENQLDQPPQPASLIKNYFRNIADVELVSDLQHSEVAIDIFANAAQNVTFVSTTIYWMDPRCTGYNKTYYGTAGAFGESKLRSGCEDIAAKIDTALDPIRKVKPSLLRSLDDLPDDPTQLPDLHFDEPTTKGKSSTPTLAERYGRK